MKIKYGRNCKKKINKKQNNTETRKKGKNGREKKGTEG